MILILTQEGEGENRILDCGDCTNKNAIISAILRECANIVDYDVNDIRIKSTAEMNRAISLLLNGTEELSMSCHFETIDNLDNPEMNICKTNWILHKVPVIKI